MTHLYCRISAFFWIIIMLGITAISPTAWTEDSQEAKEKTAGAETATIKPASLPAITIGGRNVMEVVEAQKNSKAVPTPNLLDDPVAQHYMKKRMRGFDHPPFAHNPRTGPTDAPIIVIEISDVGCIECTDWLKQADEALKNHKDYILRVQIFGPNENTTLLRSASFYSKVAQANKAFWPYRKKLLELKATSSDAYFNLLHRMGLDVTDIRDSAINSYHKFYRELDADTKLVKKLKLKSTPVWIVNGILVSPKGGIPLEKLDVLITYEKALYDYKQKINNINKK